MTATRVSIFIALILIVTATYAADLDIVGKWQVRNSEYPLAIDFLSDGTVEIDSPGMVVRSKCQFAFDSNGAPAELVFVCDNDGEESVRKLWVVVLSETAIHLRRQHTELGSASTDILVDMTLDKIDE